MTAWPSPKFERYLNHWHALRRDRSLPLLTDYLDTAIADIQPWMGIVDIKSDTFQPLRLMGTGLVTYFGVDGTGENFFALQSPQALPHFRRAHQEVPRRPCGALFRGTCSTSRVRNVEMDGFALPFQASGGHCVAWCLSPVSELGSSETGLAIIAVTSTQWVDLGHGVPA